MHAYRHSKLPISFQNFFVQNTHAINLKINETVYRERAQTKHNFLLIWNQIDSTIRVIPSKQIFKKSLMKLAIATLTQKTVHFDNIRCFQCHEKKYVIKSGKSQLLYQNPFTPDNLSAQW